MIYIRQYRILSVYNIVLIGYIFNHSPPLKGVPPPPNNFFMLQIPYDEGNNS